MRWYQHQGKNEPIMQKSNLNKLFLVPQLYVDDLHVLLYGPNV